MLGDNPGVTEKHWTRGWDFQAPASGPFTGLAVEWLVQFPSLSEPQAFHLSNETWVQFLGREDPLEKEMATHYSTLAWKITWTEEPGRLQSMGSWRVGNDWVTSLIVPWCDLLLYAYFKWHNSMPNSNRYMVSSFNVLFCLFNFKNIFLSYAFY